MTDHQRIFYILHLPQVIPVAFKAMFLCRTRGILSRLLGVLGDTEYLG